MKTLTQFIKECMAKGGQHRTYECLNRGTSSFGNIAKGFQGRSIKYNPETVIYSSFLNEGIDYEPDQNERGGIIVLSTDVNAVKMSENRFVNYCKQKFATFKNRFTSKSKIDRVAQSHDLVGWTIGHYLDGRYTAKNGKAFGEKSLSVEVIGVETDKLISIAEDICRDFMQECVLVKDYSSGRIMFVNPD